jgi:hypothetical protein
MTWQIEEYLRARGVQYFRGHHDDEFLYFVHFLDGTYRGRLDVHLEADGADPGTLLVNISPDRFFPAEKRARLAVLAEEWNAGQPVIQAVVHGSSDPRLVGLQARGRTTLTDPAALSGFVDAAVAAGIGLFGRVAAEIPTSDAVLRDAG